MQVKPMETKDPNVTEENLAILRDVLSRLRWHDQGGFASYSGDGRWTFVSTGLPQTSPAELNALLDLAGIVPDKIESIGDCGTCQYSKGGHETGCIACWKCMRPMMSNYKQKEGENEC